MNKPVKIALISLGSIIGLLVIAILVVSTFFVSKEQLTKTVKDVAADYVTCPTDVESVELTFFSSFPDVSLCINDFSIINPMEGAQSDTVVHVHRLFAKIDVMAYLKQGSINISGFTLQDAQANLFVNEDSVPNYNVFNLEADTTQQEDTTSEAISLDQISLHNIEIQNLSATYLDRSLQMESRCRNVNLVLNTDANLQELTGGGDIDLEIGELFYSDSLNYAQLSDLKLKNTHLYYDGKEASVKMPKLYVATQDYLLSGETALLAKIWGMELADIEAEWKNDRPTFKGVTRLDSSNVTLGKEDLMYISTEGVSFDMPVSSSANRWTTNVNTQVDGFCFSTDADGQLADHLNLKTQFEASTNTTFNEFWVRDMLTQINDQKLSGQVHVDMQDTTLLKAEVDATLGATTIEDILALVPAAYKESLKGMNLKSNLSDTRLTANLEVGKELNLKQVKVTSQLNKFQYSDDTNLTCDINTLDATVIYPAGARGKEFRIVGKMNKLDVAMVDDSTNLHVDIPGGTADLLMRDDILNGKDPRLTAQFDLEDFQVKMDDTVQVEIQTPQGKADIDMASVKNCIKVDAKVGLSGLALQMGGGLRGVTGQATADFSCLYDDRQKDVLDQVSPEAKFKLVNGNFNIDGIPYPVELPELNATFNKDKAELSTCQLNLGNSKMSLQGTISNINDWLKEKALLEGKISLSSPLVDVGQLMDLTSGLGCEEDSVAATDAKPAEANAAATSATDTVAEPFMVPKDVNFVITTNIKTAKVNDNSFDNVNGQLTIDDGVLVLEEMGFTSKAAKMQLTALYKSPRRNNLFVGWNFHLLDIDIAEMIKLVPEIDTIVPMLSSFAGKAEFHLAGETSLFADYSPKMSTLQATAAIEGKDLTVLDSETFQTIKKYLFKDCTTNKIDTLSVEMAVNRKKMTLYPMLIGWDKYEAVISGNHNITGSMPFNYHISITKCPLVGGHLGLNILGDLDHLDDISFKLGECKYANLYKPEKRRLSQEQTLELKKLINTSLKRMVREE